MRKERDRHRCNACADTEGGFLPCRFQIAFAETEPKFCPVSGEECEWEPDGKKRKGYVAAIREEMSLRGLRQKDMIPYFGSKSRTSEALSKKAPLTLKAIRRLHAGIGIPLGILTGRA